MAVWNGLSKKVADAVKSCKPLMMQPFHVSEKGSVSNLVTTADTSVQERLRAALYEILPRAGFLGEETQETITSESYWVVDPIDGTSNFVRGMRMSVISVALVEHGEEVLGVIYDPYTEDVFSAEKGSGAYRNGTRLCVSDRDFSHALFFTAFSVYEKKYAHACQSVLADVYAQCDDFRRLGTAALELCCLAGGQGELYFEMRLFPWDWAAAAVILREAGGVIGTIDGETLRHDRPSLVLAANSEENFSKLKMLVEKHIPRLPY